MDPNDEFYFLTFEHQPLTPEQMDRLQREAVRAAKQARAQAVRRMLHAIARSPRAIVRYGLDTIGRWWTAYVGWRERRAAVKELGGLDDRTLKDLGLHRSEIESVVYGHALRDPAEGRVAAVLFHKPYARPARSLNPERKEVVGDTRAMRRGVQKAALQDTDDRAAAA